MGEAGFFDRITEWSEAWGAGRRARMEDGGWRMEDGGWRVWPFVG